jgi:hypothetical protein
MYFLHRWPLSLTIVTVRQHESHVRTIIFSQGSSLPQVIITDYAIELLVDKHQRLY